MPKPTVIDLFSGPGGFSEGFLEEDYNVLVGVDFDENSAKTYKANHSNSEFIRDDISNVSPEEIIDKAGVEPGEVDIIVGGPPCQGFSIAGERNEEDDRNQLFKEFARHIDAIRPEFFVMENVTGLLSMETPDGEPVINTMQEKFEDIGYTSKYKVLKASDYGAPQNRERVFIIGTRDDVEITFPDPTHAGDGQQTLDKSEDLSPYLTVEDALSDLPSLDAGETATAYDKQPKNNFQKHMRKHMADDDELKNHDAVNHRDHIVTRFEHIPQRGDMTDAPEEHQPSKVYSSRNRRLPEDRPSYTVTSHVLDELIHPWDDRAITVREAARLQCFPDHYEFKGERNVFHGADETSQYEQVGNAVPVALSQSIAHHLKENYL